MYCDFCCIVKIYMVSCFLFFNVSKYFFFYMTIKMKFLFFPFMAFIFIKRWTREEHISIFFFLRILYIEINLKPDELSRTNCLWNSIISESINRRRIFAPMSSNNDSRLDDYVASLGWLVFRFSNEIQSTSPVCLWFQSATVLSHR